MRMVVEKPYQTLLIVMVRILKDNEAFVICPF